MALPPQNVVAWKVCVELLHIIGILSTIYRLGYRWKIRRMWWDDYLVILPLVADGIYSAVVLLRFRHPVKPHPNPAVESYWLTTFLFLFIIWLTRITLALSLTRIFPKFCLGWWTGIGLSITFAVAFLSALLMTALTCNTLAFVNIKDDRCITGIGGYTIMYLHLAFVDIISDLLLVVASVCLLWSVRLRPRERFLILVIFSASFLTLLAAVVLSVVSFGGIALGPHPRFLFAMLMSLEVAVSLIVCNLAVVVTGVYRLFRRNGTVASEEVTNTSATNQDTTSDNPSHMSFTDISSSQGPSLDSADERAWKQEPSSTYQLTRVKKKPPPYQSSITA